MTSACGKAPYILTGEVKKGERLPNIDIRTAERVGKIATGGYVENLGFNPLTVSFFDVDNNEVALELLPGQERPTPWEYNVVSFEGGAQGGTRFRLVAR